jgi:hypothetical protein
MQAPFGARDSSQDDKRLRTRASILLFGSPMRQLFVPLFIVVSVFSTVTPGVAQSIYEPFFVRLWPETRLAAPDGTGAAARFYSPVDTAVDASGTVYVADHLNHTIRKITPAAR